MARSHARPVPSYSSMRARQRVFLPACGLVMTLAAGCDADAPANELYGLPARSGSVDTSRVNDQFRTSGGDVFVHLTGTPGSEAMVALGRAGLEAPSGLTDGPRPMLPLAPTTVWGSAAPTAVHDLAALSFVVAIEPTLDPDGSGID